MDELRTWDALKYGKVGYESYSKESGGKSLIHGEVLPKWEDLDPNIRGAWQAAALGILLAAQNENWS